MSAEQTVLLLDKEGNELGRTDSKKAAIITGAGVGTAAVATVLAAQAPAKADVTEVSNMVTSLGTLAGAALAVALVPVGIFFAIRIVKRVMNA